MNRSTGITSFAYDPALTQATGDTLMDGLSDVRAGNSQFGVSKASLNSDFPGEPYMYGYSGRDPGDGFLGALDKPATAIVRPREGAAPGWPGFFGWIASESPKMYDYLRVSLPNFVEDRQSFRSGAPELSGLDYQGGNGIGAIDISWPTVDASMPTASIPATEGTTDATPLPTTTASNQIIDVVKQAAAAFLPLVTQQRLLSINVDRARQGLPPIDTAAYESASQGINVGVNRSTQNTVLMLAAGIGGVFLLSKLLSRR